MPHLVDYEPLSVPASAACFAAEFEKMRMDPALASCIVAELENPLAALDGDVITVIGSDLQTLVQQWRAYRAALGKIASPSFKDVTELRDIAWKALHV